MRSPHSWPHLTVMTSHGPHLQTPSHLRWPLQYMNLGGGHRKQTFSPSHMLCIGAGDINLKFHSVIPYLLVWQPYHQYFLTVLRVHLIPLHTAAFREGRNVYRWDFNCQQQGWQILPLGWWEATWSWLCSLSGGHSPAFVCFTSTFQGSSVLH